MNKTKLSITLILLVVVVSVGVIADGFPELYYDINKEVLVYNRDKEIPFKPEQYENSKDILDKLEDITEIYMQDNTLYFKAEKYNEEENAQGDITFNKDTGGIIEVKQYYDNGDIYKKWDYEEGIFTEYYHDEFIKKVIDINTEQDITGTIEQQFGLQSEYIGEIKATYTDDESYITLNYMEGSTTINKNAYDTIKEELRILVNPQEMEFNENTNLLTFIAEDSETGEEYYAEIKLDEDNKIYSKTYYKDKLDEDGNYVITDITMVDNKGKITQDSQDYSLFPDFIPYSSEEKIKQEIQKEEFINKLNELVDKYKEGGKEAISEQDLIFLKNAKNIAEDYGMDEDDLTYEQKVIIQHASQTYADVFYNSVKAARGGIALSNLLNTWLDWDFMMGWRKKSDEFFSQTVIGRVISGRWEESICHHHIDRIPNNVAVVNVNNVMGFAAHIEGERSKAIITNNETIYFYKITFGVKPQIDKDEKVQFEILVDGKAVDLNKDGKSDKIELKPGESYIGTGENAVVRYKDKIYKQVCIKFYNTENLNKEFTSSLKDNKLCNTIIEAYVAPGSISKPAETAAGTGTTSSSDAW